MVDIILAEFNTGRTEPTVSSVKKYIPSVNLMVYNEVNTPNNLFDPKHERWGNRMNDYWKVKGLLNSEADVAIAMDADMKVVNAGFVSIIALAKRFGLCLPANPRHMVNVDGIIGADADYSIDEDESMGCGYAYNMSPIAFDPANNLAKDVLLRYLAEMETHPCRGPLAMWRAVWKSRFNPYVLPFPWCVCKDGLVKTPIVLHCGHPEVEKHYASS